MPNPENLNKRKSFVKNDPRINKAGRPKLPDLKLLMDEIMGEEKDGKTAAFAILAALRAKAAKGDVRAAELLLDRGWGRVKQALEVTGKDGDPILQPMTDAQVDRVLSTLRQKNETT